MWRMKTKVIPVVIVGALGTVKIENIKKVSERAIIIIIIRRRRIYRSEVAESFFSQSKMEKYFE